MSPLRLLTPHLYLEKVLDLDPIRLRALGLDGLLLDLDGTLKDYRARELPAEVLAWAAGLRSAGLRLCIVSNGKTQRIERFARKLGVPFIAKAFKPLPLGCRKALSEVGLDRGRVGIVGDQVFADVLAGRLAGLFTILVPPSHPDEPWFTRLKRPFERLVLRWLGLNLPARQAERVGRGEVAV